MISAAQLAEELDESAAGHRLLDHPFYRAWSCGELTLDDLRHYSAQYWHQVDNFPRYLSTLKESLDGPAADIVEANLRDEVDDDHTGLWLRFAEAVGADAEEVRSGTAEPQTAECVDAFREGVARSASFGLGMIYAYESQTPDVAKTKIARLKERYGIEGPGVDYFALHGELDVEHSAELVDALAQTVTDEADVAEARVGAAAGAAAIWRLLDGVERRRQEAKV